MDYIAMYRAEGNRFNHPSELLSARYQLKTNKERTVTGETPMVEAVKEAKEPKEAGNRG